MGTAFSPLDTELGLGTHQQLTPWMEECLVRLGATDSFGEAADKMAFHHHLPVSKEQVRQHTEQAGDTYVQLQAHAQAHAIFMAQPAADRQMLSVDACKVLTTTGEWRDVKTLTIAEVGPTGETGQNSYFSRQSDYHHFMAQAQVEVWRRQVRNSRAACAVNDGADWIPPVVTACRADAVRILDFYHAAEHLASAGAAAFGEGTPAFRAWFDRQRHELRDGDPDHVLADLALLAAEHPHQVEAINATQGYLTKRRAEISYVEFQAANWPIGSGPGEAAHKVVIQSRMKGAGMRWAEPTVDRMAALRTLVCSKRWATDWPLIVAAHPRRPEPAGSIPASATPARLPPGFKLRPAIPWRKQPVGKAHLNPPPAPVEND